MSDSKIDLLEEIQRLSGGEEWKMLVVVSAMLTNAAEDSLARQERERWKRVGDEPPQPGEYELAKPFTADGKTHFTRDIAKYGSDIDDEPANVWSNYDWHRDVPLEESADWYYRTPTPLPSPPAKGGSET